MSVRVEWFYRDRIILEQVYGDITIDDVSQMAEAVLSLMEAGQPPVHLLIDVRFIRKYPVSLKMMRQAVTTPVSKNAGWLVVFHNNNPMVKFVVFVLAQVMAANLKISEAKTPDAVLRFLLSRDSSLGEDLLTLSIPDAPASA
ncbi:MAG: PAS domain-containing protein [Anaerolinea sp.]|nr:PAS domain-containing protein [Anaerolinea sp.]